MRPLCGSVSEMCLSLLYLPATNVAQHKREIPSCHVYFVGFKRARVISTSPFSNFKDFPSTKTSRF